MDAAFEIALSNGSEGPLKRPPKIPPHPEETEDDAAAWPAVLPFVLYNMERAKWEPYRKSIQH